MHTSPPVPSLHALDDQFHFLKPQDSHHNNRRQAKEPIHRGEHLRIDPEARRAEVLRALDGEFWEDVRGICEKTGLRPGAVRRTLARLLRAGEVVWQRQPRCWSWKSQLYSSRLAAQGVA